MYWRAILRNSLEKIHPAYQIIGLKHINLKRLQNVAKPTEDVEPAISQTELADNAMAL
jgi:hypothetical protein